jgi:hypothetical protein
MNAVPEALTIDKNCYNYYNNTITVKDKRYVAFYK